MARKVSQCKSPDEAVRALCATVSCVSGERVELSAATGRIISGQISSDRDSPPCDVSSMDGYAVRASDLAAETLVMCGEAVPGKPPPELPAGHAVRIVTGAPLPVGADLVVPVEQSVESGRTVGFHPTAREFKTGQHIRRKGENLREGSAFAAAGQIVSPAIVAALAAFGCTSLPVFRRVRVAIINTGQELVGTNETPTPWQIRDSNGPTLRALFASHPWLDCVSSERVADEPVEISGLVSDRLRDADAVVLTGAVSMGPYDHVPGILRDLGCNVVFHRLPLRPGKPVLGAAGPGGQAIFGLPGNPVSTLVTARRLAIPVLAHVAGLDASESPPLVRLMNDGPATLPLWWYRLVRRLGPDTVELVDTKGSGDLVSAARSDGVVEIPPDRRGERPWPFYSWLG